MSRRKNSLLKETQEVAKLYGITPTKRFGQNFLINDLIYIDILEAADLKKTDRVLEVGPGLGFLTFSLAERVQEVMAVEIDKKITRILPERIKLFGYKNARVINGDVLDIVDIPEANEFIQKKYKVVANLPYNITSVFLRKFLALEHQPESFTLMLQKEVAERITAKPGKMSLLALSVQYYATANYCFSVDKSNFWPEPEVQSAVIKIVVNKKNPLPADDEKKFWRLLKIAFAAKRKMLKKNLATALPLDAEDFSRILALVGVEDKARPQDLSLQQWLKLFSLLKRDVL